MKREHAEAISKLMLEYGAKIDASVKLVMDEDSPEAFQTYRRAAGRVMGEMWCEIMAPLYKEHPELVPDEMEASSKPRPPEPR